MDPRLRSFPRALTCFGLFLALVTFGRAQSFPSIPASDRVLTTQEVKNFWINKTLRTPVPPKPTGLHPHAQARWSARLRERHSFVEAIRSGQFDTKARLTKLEHNIQAWQTRDNEEKARESERDLRELREHLSRLETLRLQRKAARAQIDAAERVAELEAEIYRLQRLCNSDC